MVYLGIFPSGPGKPMASRSLGKPIDNACSRVPPTEWVRPRDLHADALNQLPDPITQLGKGEPRSPNPQAARSPSAALQVHRQERVIQLAIKGQPGEEMLLLLEKHCDEHGIYNLAISANICVLCWKVHFQINSALRLFQIIILSLQNWVYYWCKNNKLRNHSLLFTLRSQLSFLKSQASLGWPQVSWLRGGWDGNLVEGQVWGKWIV